MASGQLPEDMLPGGRLPEKDAQGRVTRDHLPVTPEWPDVEREAQPHQSGTPPDPPPSSPEAAAPPMDAPL